MSATEVDVAKIGWKEADGTVASVTEYRDERSSTYKVVFNYTVDERVYGGTFTTSQACRRGDSVAVRYDPKNPGTNDLGMKEKRKRWIMIAVVVVLAAGAIWLRWLF